MRWINFDPQLEHALCCWDQQLVQQLVGHLPDNVMGTAARYQLDHVSEINEELAKYEQPVLLLTSDEDSTFPFDKIVHPNLHLWIQSPRASLHLPQLGLRYLPVGYSTEDWEGVRELPPDHQRDLSWYFAGQVTHPRREQCWEALTGMENPEMGELLATHSFISPAGEPRSGYLTRLARAIVAPAPSGPVSADTFRCWEALEAGAVPVVDAGPLGVHYSDGFWHLLLGGEPPFPIVPHWEHGPAHIQNIIARYPRCNNEVFAWWQGYKRRLRVQMEEDAGYVDDRAITVVIPTSPIPSHPSTEVLEAVYLSVRERLPTAEIMLLFDGVPVELAHRTSDYEEYTRRALWLTNHVWTDITPVLHRQHLHQAEMLRRALREINTRFILFVEHDTPIGNNSSENPNDIPFADLCHAIETGELNIVRLHHESFILEPHRHLIMDYPTRKQTRGSRGTSEVVSQPYYPTVQWSQRPHLASTNFYRWLLDTYFDLEDRTFIEDRMHGIVQDSYARYGQEGWRQFRIGIYAPEGDMKRSWHLDGRGEDPKTNIYRVAPPAPNPVS